jgi:hypothetical protein
MRVSARILSMLIPILALLAGMTAPIARAADANLEHPLAHGKLSLRDGKPGARRVVFRASWQPAADEAMNPVFDGSTLRVYGKGPNDGDSGLISLEAARWHALGRPPGKRGYRYVDPSGSAGGVRQVTVKMGKKHGLLRIVGGRGNWRYAIVGAQTEITVTFTIGQARWCAVFGGKFVKNGKGHVLAERTDAPQSCPCARGNSTLAAIQEVIFERHGCTTNLCHGSSVQGGLDLRPDAAYHALVDVPSTKRPDLKRIEPGEQALSFLWLKLAAKTLPDQYQLGSEDGAPMPQNLAPISSEELEALRLWIRAGAPETGVVLGTENLLDACLPPPDPIKIRAPEPPAPDEGVQFHAPQWTIKAHGEGEVCFATAYDVSASVPPDALVPCPSYIGGVGRQCFYYNHDELTQDPNSHHSIIHIYQGKYDNTQHDVFWCDGGTHNKQICDPSAPGMPAPNGDDCGGGSCVPYDIRTADSGFGPFTCRGGSMDGQACDPLNFGVAAPAGNVCPDGSCGGKITSTIACIGYGPPDYGTDVTGTGTASAPAFGGSQQPFTRQVFPGGVYTVLPVKGIIVWNSHAFNLTDAPTTNEQWFNLYYSRSATDHQYPLRGVFDSRDIFIMDVPPFQKHEYCRTHTFPKGAHLFEFSSHTHKRGKLFRIFGPGIHDRCGSEAGLTAPADCAPKPEDGPTIFTTTIYNDPEQLHYPQPVVLDSDNEDSRTYKFCGLYDNGMSNSDEVKRQSTSPLPPAFGLFEGLVGGPCPNTTVACLSGTKKGQLCHGNDSECDSPGLHDGVCDACPVHGGVTTEDEMFILLGNFYLVP